MAAFEEDFLQTITSVQWGGGPWFGIRFSLLTGTPSWEVNFPSKSAGTPGYSVMTDGAISGRALQLPITMTNLSNPLPTDAGAAFKGFMGRDTSQAKVVDLLIQMDAKNFPATFPVRILRFADLGAQTAYQIYTVKKKIIKAGTRFVLGADFSRTAFPTIDKHEINAQGDINTVYNWTVSPSTGAITRLPPFDA